MSSLVSRAFSASARLGAADQITAELVRPAGNGPSLPETAAGDDNLDLDDCP